jgi:hypothetical protein
MRKYILINYVCFDTSYALRRGSSFASIKKSDSNKNRIFNKRNGVIELAKRLILLYLQ